MSAASHRVLGGSGAVTGQQVVFGCRVAAALCRLDWARVPVYSLLG